MKIFKYLYILIFPAILNSTFLKKDIINIGEGPKHIDVLNVFLYSDFYAWYDHTFPGEGSIWISHIFPMDLFFIIFTQINLSFQKIQFLWFYSITFFSIVSMMYLIKILARIFSIKNYDWWQIFSSSIYVCNFFLMYRPGDENTRLVLAVLPAVLGLLIAGLQNYNFKYAIKISLLSSLCSPSAVNIAVYSVIFIIIASYLVFFCATRNVNYMKLLKFLVVFISTYILINAWWLFISIPNMLSISNDYQQVMAWFLGSSGSISDVFRLMGSWAFNEKFNGEKLVSYSGYYYGDNFLITTSSLLIFIIALLPILRINNDLLKYIFGLLFIGIFLAKGTGMPFGIFYSLLLEYIPNFWIFREPYTKFTLLNILSISILFGFSCLQILDYLSKKIR